MVAPADALAAIPDQLSSVDAAPLLCAGVTTFNALRHSGAMPGDVVAVLGIGGLGHLMALMNATFEVQSRGGSLAAIARETAPNSNRRFQQQHRVDFPILNDATAAVARSFGIGWTEAYLQSLYDQFVADRTGDSPEPSWIEPMQARYVVARDGTIAYVDINTDYRVAPELAAAMAALRRL